MRLIFLGHTGSSHLNQLDEKVQRRFRRNDRRYAAVTIWSLRDMPLVPNNARDGGETPLTFERVTLLPPEYNASSHLFNSLAERSFGCQRVIGKGMTDSFCRHEATEKNCSRSERGFLRTMSLS